MNDPQVDSPRPRRWKRLAFLSAGTLLLLVVVLVLGAVFGLRGEPAGRLVTGLLADVLPGQLKIKAIHWEARLLADLVTDGKTPIVIEGIELRDPEGRMVLNLPRLELKVPPRSAMNAQVLLHDVKIGPDAHWVFGPMKKQRGTGFLKALVPPSTPPPPGAPPPPPRPAGEPPPPAFVFKMVNVDLQGLTAEFDYPGTWGVLLGDIHGKANFTLEGDFVGFDAYDLDARKGGHLIILTEKLPLDTAQITRVATLPEYRNDIFLDLRAGNTGRSVLSGKGFFTHIYDDGDSGVDLHAEFASAADALNAVAAPHLPDIGALQVDGEQASVKIDLKNAWSQLVINGLIADLDVTHGTRVARDLDFDVRFDVNPMTVLVKSLTFADPEGGGVGVGVKLENRAAAGQPDALHLAATVGLRDFHTESYLPPALRPMLAGRVQADLSAAWDIAGGQLQTQIPGLRLSRRHRAGLPRTISVSGGARATMGDGGVENIETDGLRIQVPGASARAEGRIGLLKQALDLSLRAVAGNLPLALQPFGVPAVADSATVTARVRGSLDNPTVVGEAVVLGAGGKLAGPVPPIPELTAKFSLKNGVASLQRLEAALLGGNLEVSGQAQLYRASLEKMLRTPIIDVRVNGKELRLKDVLGDGPLSGALTFEAEARGPVNRLAGRLALPDGTQLSVLGQTWSLSGLAVTIAEDVVTLSTTRLARDGGGSVELEGHLSLKGPMAMEWHLVIEGFPVGAVPGLPDAGVTGFALDGRIDVDLRLGGSPTAPTATGRIGVRSVVVNGAALGDIRLDVETTMLPGVGRRAKAIPSVRVNGHIFDLFGVDATAKLTPAGPDVQAQVSFDKLAVETLLPRVLLALTPPGATAPSAPPEALKQIASRLTGHVKVALTPGVPLAVDLLLSDLFVRAQPPGVMDTPVTLRNRGDIRAGVQGDRISLKPAHLVTEAGELTVAGSLFGDELTSALSGEFDLAVLAPFLGGQVERIAGGIGVGLRATGTVSRPTVEGSIEIKRPIVAKIPALATPIEIPSGIIRLHPRAVEMSKLALRMDTSNLVLGGRIDFSDTHEITALSADARGSLDARLLAAVAPGAVIESSGRLDISGRVTGTPSAPVFDARLKARDLLLRLRDPSNRLEVKTADLAFNSREATLTNVEIIVDDTGILTIGSNGAPPGKIVFEQLLPTLKIRHASLPIVGEHLSYRSPGVVEIDDLGFSLELSGDLEQNTLLSGEVRVVSGRVVWDFNVGDLVISPRIVEGYGKPRPPDPFLDNMKLDLNVRTIGDTFLVQNNIAPELYMLVDVYVSGTATRPKIAGGLFPTDGRFRILGLRGDFDLVPGANQITFEPTKSLADLQTPWLNMEAENRVTDTSGNDHLVTMRISGPVGQMQIEFSSDTGLTQNQVFLLLGAGTPTTDGARFGTSNATLTGNVNTGIGLVGQAGRDVMATLLEPYVTDTLALLTGSTMQLRPTIGPDGVEVRLFGRFSRQLRLQLDYLQGFQNDRRARADVSLWLHDYMTLRSVGEHLQLAPQPGITETFNSVTLEMMLEWPLRYPRP